MVQALKTRVTDILGVDCPVVVGTMGQQSYAEFVAAAANAGAFACLASAMFRTSEALRQEIRKTKALTNRPFGVNVNLFPMISPISNEEYVDVTLDEGVPVIETSGRSPEHLVDRIKKGNATLVHKCVGVRHARKAQQLGADIVEVVGFEAAGHPGRDPIGTLVLIPQIVDAVEIPVVAGGGIADARGLVAALALGAEGVVIGTRFMATTECPLHPDIKDKLLDAQEGDTMLLTLHSNGDPMRALRNDLAVEIKEMVETGASWEEVTGLIGGGKGRRALAQGEADKTILSVGQAVGLVHEILPIKDVIEKLMLDSVEVNKRLSRMVKGRNSQTGG